MGDLGLWSCAIHGDFPLIGLTGDLYIGDVGQDAWEEIDYLPAGSPGGENFGWSYYEGMHAYRGSPPAGMQVCDASGRI